MCRNFQEASNALDCSVKARFVKNYNLNVVLNLDKWSLSVSNLFFKLSFPIFFLNCN